MRRVLGLSLSLLLLALLHSAVRPDSVWAWRAHSSAGAPYQEADSAQQETAPTQQEGTPPSESQQALVEQAGTALDRLDEIQDSLTVLIDRAERGGLPEDELDLLSIQARPLVEESRGLIEELPSTILQIEGVGGSAEEIRGRLGSLLGWFSAEYLASLVRGFAELSTLAAAQDNATAGDLANLAALGQELRDGLLTSGLGVIHVLDQAQTLGLEVTQEFANFDATLLDRADALVGRLQIRVLARERERTALAEAQSAEVGEEAIEGARRQMLDADERVDGAATTLSVVSDLLEARGYPTAEYRQLVIQATGEVTGDLFNPRVLLGLARGWLNDGARWLRDAGPTILARIFLVLLIVWALRLLFRFGWWLLRVTGIVRMQRLASDLLGRSLQPIATVLGLIVGLWTVGVDSTALLTGLGVFSLIVGLAIQDSLSNLAAGLFILAHRPYDVDDVIETGGLLGRVVAMGLASTTLVTFDNRKVFVPNRKIWGDVIANRSTEPTRRVDVSVEVSDQEDLDRVFSVLHTLLEEHEYVLQEPEPHVFMKGREDSWRTLEVRPWVKSEHWWDLKSTLPALIDRRFSEEGIRAPAPRREISYAGGAAGATSVADAAGAAGAAAESERPDSPATT